MSSVIDTLLSKHGLSRLASVIEPYVLPCIGFDLIESNDRDIISSSRTGGSPCLPRDFDWPTNKGRPLDFLVQLNLNEVSQYVSSNVLPSNGILTFFYDLENQPWSYDPKDLGGYKTVLFPNNTDFAEKQAPFSEFAMPQRLMQFRKAFSVPFFGTRSYDTLKLAVNLTSEEEDRFCEFGLELSDVGSNYPRQSWGGHHQVLGHSQNVQGDMQLEAQLVTHGLYCGDSSGYNDPRAKALEDGADDWELLLQLDSDETCDLMWGDVGMLYFWIRRQDLSEQRFEKVWMTLQCG